MPEYLVMGGILVSICMQYQILDRHNTTINFISVTYYHPNVSSKNCHRQISNKDDTFLRVMDLLA